MQHWYIYLLLVHKLRTLEPGMRGGSLRAPYSGVTRALANFARRFLFKIAPAFRALALLREAA